MTEEGERGERASKAIFLSSLESPTTKTGHKAQRNEEKDGWRRAELSKGERERDSRTDQTEITGVNYVSQCSVPGGGRHVNVKRVGREGT